MPGTAVAGRTLSGPLSDTLAQLREISSLEHMAVHMDVSDSAQVDKAVAELAAAHGSVQILVNAAGVCHDGLLMRRPKDQIIEDTLGTNLAGPIYTSRAVAKGMAKRRSGVIINIGSVVGSEHHKAAVAVLVSSVVSRWRKCRAGGLLREQGGPRRADLLLGQRTRSARRAN